MLNSLSSLFRSSKDLSAQTFDRTIDELFQNGWTRRLSSHDDNTSTEFSTEQNSDMDVYIFSTRLGSGLISIPRYNTVIVETTVITQFGIQRFFVDGLKSESSLRASVAFEIYVERFQAIFASHGIDTSDLMSEYDRSVYAVAVEDGFMARIVQGFESDTILVDVIVPNGFESHQSWSGFKNMFESAKTLYRPNPELKSIPKLLNLLPDLGMGISSSKLKQPVFDGRKQTQKIADILSTLNKLVTVLTNLENCYYTPMNGLPKIYEHLKTKAIVKVDVLLNVTKEILAGVDVKGNQLETLLVSYNDNHHAFSQEFSKVSVAIDQARTFVQQLMSTPSVSASLSRCKQEYETKSSGDGSLSSIYNSITKIPTDLVVIFKDLHQNSHPSRALQTSLENITSLGQLVNSHIQQNQDRQILFSLDSKMSCHGRLTTSGEYVMDIFVNGGAIMIFDKFIVVLDQKLQFVCQIAMRDLILFAGKDGFEIGYNNGKILKFDYDCEDSRKSVIGRGCTSSMERREIFISCLRHYILLEKNSQEKQSSNVYGEIIHDINVYYKILETGSIDHSFQFQKRNDIAFLLFDENYDLSNIITSLNSYNAVCAIQLCPDNQYKWTCRIQDTELWALNENRFLLPPLKDQPSVDFCTLQKELRATLRNASRIKTTHPVFYTSNDIQFFSNYLTHSTSKISITKPNLNHGRVQSNFSSMLSSIFAPSVFTTASINPKRNLIGRLKRNMSKVVKTILPGQMAAKIKMELKKIVEIVKFLSELDDNENTGSKSAKGVINDPSPFQGHIYDCHSLLDEESVFSTQLLRGLLEYARSYGLDQYLTPYMEEELRTLRASKQRFLYDFATFVKTLDSKMESKQLKFYHGDFLYTNAASALTTLFWNKELENSKIDYANARTNLLECLIFNYREIFKTISEAEVEKSVGVESENLIIRPLEIIPEFKKPQPMLTAGFVEATFVELGPLPFTVKVEGYEILDIVKFDSTKYEPVTVNLVKDSIYTLSIDPSEIYTCLTALADKEKQADSHGIESLLTILDESTWTSFNTFDLPPLTVPTTKPILFTPDSQKSIFEIE